MRGLGFEQCEVDACVMRLLKEGSVSIVVVVHVDDISAMGRKSRCDRFCEDLNQFVPIVVRRLNQRQRSMTRTNGIACHT